MALNPVQIMKSEAEEEKAETARLSSFVGAIAIGELVRSTLGPRGMDKILVALGRNEGLFIFPCLISLQFSCFLYLFEFFLYAFGLNLLVKKIDYL